MITSKIKCHLCTGRTEGFFFNIEKSIAKKIDTQKTVHVYQPDQVIFHEGNPAFAVYCLHDGQIKLTKTGEKGEQKIIRLLGPGDILGYRAILANEPLAASAETLTACTVCIIPREIFTDILQLSPELSMKMMKKLSQELRVSEEQILSLLNHSVRQRAARMLLTLGEAVPGSNKGPYKIPHIQKNELAQMIGTTPETMSRTLKFFAQKGLIRLTHNTITVKNLPSLRKMAREFKSRI